MKVVKVLWIDSCNSNMNWTIAENIEVEPMDIESFGIVIKDTDEFLAIAQNYGDDPEQYSNITTIPKGCIKEVFVIHEDNVCENESIDKVEQKPTDKEMKELLRTEYEKGRADAIAETQVAWSEEDKVMLDEIIDFFENGTVKLQHDLSLYASWLKSLEIRITNKQ